GGTSGRTRRMPQRRSVGGHRRGTSGKLHCPRSSLPRRERRRPSALHLPSDPRRWFPMQSKLRLDALHHRPVFMTDHDERPHPLRVPCRSAPRAGGCDCDDYHHHRHHWRRGADARAGLIDHAAPHPIRVRAARLPPRPDAEPNRSFQSMSSAPQLLGDAVASAASSVLAALRPAAATTRVHKFGGSSVADAERIARLAPLVDDGAQVCVVVVSAMAGTTNALVAMATQAASGQDWSGDWSALRERHLQTADALDPDARHGLRDAVGRDFDGLRDDLLALASATGPLAPPVAQVHGLGELVSSRLVQAALGGEAGGWQRLDARDVLVVHPGDMGVGVDWDASRARFGDWRARNLPARVVVTGFVARNGDGQSTTLGRNGSDYSAAIFANLADA